MNATLKKNLWYLVPTKVQGSNWHTLLHPSCKFTHKCCCATTGPSCPAWTICSSLTERPNMRQRFLRESPPPPFADPSSPCSLGRDSLPPSQLSLPHSHRIPPSLTLGGRLRVAHSIVGNINDKVLWRPWRRQKKKNEDHASESYVPHCSIRKLLQAALRLQTNLAQRKHVTMLIMRNWYKTTKELQSIWL